MRVLPRVVVPLFAVLPLAVASLAGVAGCSQFNKALGQQQALVSFRAGTPDPVRMQVRAACGKLPNVSPKPLPSGVPLSQSLAQVVYEVSNASNADKARLQECLAKYPSVAGMTLQDSSDTGA